MAIILNVGRNNLKTRLVLASILFLLIAGSVTMVYPFLLMTAGSTKSGVDTKSQSVVPEFLYKDEALYKKHIEGLFNESSDAMNIAYGTDYPSFEYLKLPEKTNAALVAQWENFIKENPPAANMYACGYLRTPVSRTLPKHLRLLKRELATESGGDIDKLNESLGTQFPGWNSFFVIPDNYLERNIMPQDIPLMRKLWDYKARQEPGELYYFSPEGFYKKIFLKNQYSKDIEKYNDLHGTAYASYDEIILSKNLPDGTLKEKEDWENFIRFSVNPLWIRLNQKALQPYREYLKEKYDDIQTLNKNYGTDYKSFSEVPLPGEDHYNGLPLSDLVAFLMGWQSTPASSVHKAPSESLEVYGLDLLFRDYLRKKFGTVEKLNKELGTDFVSFDRIGIPQMEMHYFHFDSNKTALRKEFVTRNYVAVTDYMLIHGRGIFNTVVYCALSVLFAIFFNPLAAYALSRFKLPSAYIILLFMMLTMAFPPMVTQIPVFLTLRELGLLNSFYALVLPGLANGFSIFLLKGFFDSLPKELYESASIDGASEWTIFWQITMSLSTPVLAVIALGAFTAAYSNFMFALLICQDEQMWTLMVWLYQLQQRSGEGVLHASLIIAALPMLLIFIFCQKMIMRGIVIPSEK